MNASRIRRRGITLIEMLVSISLVLLTMATLFLFYTIALDATKRAGEHTVRIQRARVVLHQMAREIRQAAAGAQQTRNALAGKMHSLTIDTTTMPPATVMQTYGLEERPPTPASDVRRIEYYLAVDPEATDEDGNLGVLGLVRREQKQLNKAVIDLDDREVLKEVRMMAPDVRYIRLRYFDGGTWQDVWRGGSGVNGLPQAVKITIGFEPDVDMLSGQEETLQTEFDLMGNPQDEPPVKGRYSLIVRLPSANAMMAQLKAAQQGRGENLGSGL